MTDQGRELPTLEEAKRALEYVGWAYQSCFQTATDMYRERYGDAPNFAVDAPDGGLLYGLGDLVDALNQLEQANERIAEQDQELRYWSNR